MHERVFTMLKAHVAHASIRSQSGALCHSRLSVSCDPAQAGQSTRNLMLSVPPSVTPRHYLGTG